MDINLRKDADTIIAASIKAVQPDAAVKRALMGKSYPGNVYLVAAGKAAWQMSKTATECLGNQLTAGVCVTKYNHVMGDIDKVVCFEAGHPVPDENSFIGTQAAIDLISNLSASDTVVFLVSGGGSALFEKPLIPSEELQNITNQLLSCGADIVEINTIRKRLSAVKGGKFAMLCHPAHVDAIILSDILGDPLDMIASGPACPDSTSKEDALRIVQKYSLSLSEESFMLLNIETPKSLDNVSTMINGSVRQLCLAAEEAAKQLGYEPVLLTDQLCCQAKEAGSFLGSILKTHYGSGKKLAFLAGGETIVQLTGKGKGGRNQELALAAAPIISSLNGCAVFSVGSDGTDGPTDAAGGYVDYTSSDILENNNISIYDVLKNNDAYNALLLCDGLIITGPTGTNVNDIAVALLNT